MQEKNMGHICPIGRSGVKEHNRLQVQDIYYIAVLKFYFKLVNNHLPHYFNSFTSQFSAGHQQDIHPDYCQKLNTNFQDNLCAID